MWQSKSTAAVHCGWIAWHLRTADTVWWWSWPPPTQDLAHDSRHNDDCSRWHRPTPVSTTATQRTIHNMMHEPCHAASPHQNLWNNWRDALPVTQPTV